MSVRWSGSSHRLRPTSLSTSGVRNTPTLHWLTDAQLRRRRLQKNGGPFSEAVDFASRLVGRPDPLHPEGQYSRIASRAGARRSGYQARGLSIQESSCPRTIEFSLFAAKPSSARMAAATTVASAYG